jgi:GNAT superfamily N-acetyltransferase
VRGDLRDLAEDPDFFLLPPEEGERIADERFCVLIEAERRRAAVCRLRLSEEPRLLEGAVEEILSLVRGIATVVWNVGSSAQPADLPARLRALGLREPEPPLDAVAAAMTLTEEPDAVDDVEVRRIETLDDHLVGLEILLASDAWSADARAGKRARAVKTFERERRRGNLQWLAYLDGTPLAWAAGERASPGLFLAGAATLPEERGRGCYRALVRARWDEAVRLGLPGLAVQAQYASSAPILRGLGFVEAAMIHTLQS